MPRNTGSVAATISQAQRRSNRANRGCNGRDVQLDRLAEQLDVPTRKAKKRFAPDEGVQLEVNARAPPPKKRRTRTQTHAAQSLPPVALLSPRQQSPTVVKDDRYGFSDLRPTQPMTVPTPIPLLAPAPPLSPSPAPSSMPTPPPCETLQQSGTLTDNHEVSDSGSDNDESALQPEIDENSDDEDDRRAHTLLRAAPHLSAVTPVQQTSPAAVQHGNRSFVEFGADQSVLQNHYSRNRPPKAPSFRHHPRTPRPASRRQPHTDTNSGPQTLESYPPQWQEVINQAKRAFRAYVAGKCGFPDPVSGVREARECLADAVEVYNEEGGALEPGDITREMTMLVFAELWQLRSQLKTDIRVQVHSLKALFPDDSPSNPEGHGHQAAIRDTISAWIANGSYLHDTIPGSNRQAHFGHPIIASTCKLFYFDKWSDISTFDHDTFHGLVPEQLVALVGAVYRNVLDEWSSGSPTTKKLETKRYSLVYQGILDAMGIVDNDVYWMISTMVQFFANALHPGLDSAGLSLGRSMNNPTTSTHVPVTIHLDLSPPAN